MMHAVIRTSNDCIHLIGHVDGYNIESLRDHVRGMARHGDVSLWIELAPGDDEALKRLAGRWLDRLARSGVPVSRPSGHDPRRPFVPQSRGLGQA